MRIVCNVITDELTNKTRVCVHIYRRFNAIVSQLKISLF